MSKQKASSSALTIDQVMNDINARLADEDYGRDEVEDGLDNLCGELDEENEKKKVILMSSLFLKMKLLEILMAEKNNH